jgi:hypothetical protein
MIVPSSGARVWLAAGMTDMRRGMNSLALQVQQSLGRDPHTGDLYVFRGERGDLLKVLWHARRLDRPEFGEIEFDNCTQCIGERTVLLVVRQSVQPAGVLCLQLHGGSDGVVPPLDPGAPISGTTCANNRCTTRARGTIAGLAFGAGHGLVIDRLTGHGSTPNRYVTLEPRSGSSGSCRHRPGRGGLAPVGLTARHHCQAVRAILLASATATSLRGLRSSKARNQSVICRLPGFIAALITEVAPETNNVRRRSLPARLICNRCERRTYATRW